VKKLFTIQLTIIALTVLCIFVSTIRFNLVHTLENDKLKTILSHEFFSYTALFHINETPTYFSEGRFFKFFDVVMYSPQIRHKLDSNLAFEDEYALLKGNPLASYNIFFFIKYDGNKAVYFEHDRAMNVNVHHYDLNLSPETIN